MFLLLALLVAQPHADTTAPADTTGPDIIYYGGKRVIFYAKREEVVLLDSAWVRYRGMSVYSDSIHYDVKKHVMSAYEDVLFNSGSENISGNLLVYDIDTRKGVMHTARTEVQNGFFRAREVWLVHERVLNARGGHYTTCNREHPHYTFYGPRVKLFMDDVAITQPVVLQVFRVPIVAAPFWLVPVSSKRKSGLMPFKIGNSSTEGYYSKNMAYYLVINDYSDVTFYADLMTKKGLQTRLEGVYIVNPIASGSLNGSYITEWDTKRRRYSLNAVHSSQFFFGTELNASADIMSDASYVPDYSEERLDWLKQDLYSYAELSRRLGQVGRFSTRAERYVDFIHHSRYYELPVARLNFGARPIAAGWNFTPGVAIANRVESYADSTNHDTASTTRRRGSANVNISSPQYSIGTLGSLSAMQALGLGTVRTYYNDSLRSKPLNANHSVQVSADQRFYGTLANTEAITFNQTDDLSDSLPVNVRYAGSISSSVTFFRVYGIEGMGMHGLLHSVRPSAGLSYEPKVDTGGFFGRPHFGKPDQASLQLGMVHAFQAKVDTLRTKRDLGTITFSTRYDFVDTVQHLKPLYGVLSFLPLQGTNARMQVEATASYLFDSAKLSRDYQVNTSFYGTSIKADSFEIERGVQLSVNHTWGRSGDMEIHMITGSASVAAFGWKVSLNSIGYNFKDITGKKLTDYSITVQRNLHCWEAIANFQKLGPKWKYDFEIRIKKLPDIKFGKSTFRTFIPGED